MTACQFSLIAAEGDASQPGRGRLAPSRGRSTTDCGRASSRCCRSSRAIPDIRAVSGWIVARYCAGFCSCSIRGFAESFRTEPGFGSRMTCRRRLPHVQQAAAAASRLQALPAMTGDRERGARPECGALVSFVLAGRPASSGPGGAGGDCWRVVVVWWKLRASATTGAGICRTSWRSAETWACQRHAVSRSGRRCCGTQGLAACGRGTPVAAVIGGWSCGKSSRWSAASEGRGQGWAGRRAAARSGRLVEGRSAAELEIC